MKIKIFLKILDFLFQISFLTSFRPGVANQRETKNHVFYCVTAKSFIILEGTLKHYLNSNTLFFWPERANLQTTLYLLPSPFSFFSIHRDL